MTFPLIATNVSFGDMKKTSIHYYQFITSHDIGLIVRDFPMTVGPGVRTPLRRTPLIRVDPRSEEQGLLMMDAQLSFASKLVGKLGSGVGEAQNINVGNGWEGVTGEP